MVGLCFTIFFFMLTLSLVVVDVTISEGKKIRRGGLRPSFKLYLFVLEQVVPQ
jgi:hypothetical protein